MNDKEKTVVIVGGVTAAGLIGYKYMTGRWPWEGPYRGKLKVTGVEVPESAGVGESFDVRATVENTGDVEAMGTVKFTYNETETGRRDVTVPVGMEKTVTLSMSIPQAGTYSVCAEVPQEEEQSVSGACVSAEVR